MQLVAYGAQDIYLTGNPQITFFKVVYRRHTNFSMETIQQTLDGTTTLNATSNTNASCTISRNGDLVGRVYVVTRSNGVTDGSKLVNEVELEIGGQRIDKQTEEWMNVWNELTTDETKALPLKAMSGCVGSSSTTGVENLVQVPLQFWFCRNPGLALPLIALQYHEVKLKFKWGTGNDVGTDAECEVFCEYIYLDTDERRRFAQISHEYLIEQVQHQVEGTASTSYTLNLNHPVKELIWTDASEISTQKANLKLDGHDRFSEQHREYFQLRQPFDHHTAVPKQNLPTAARVGTARATVAGDLVSPNVAGNNELLDAVASAAGEVAGAENTNNAIFISTTNNVTTLNIGNTGTAANFVTAAAAGTSAFKVGDTIALAVTTTAVSGDDAANGTGVSLNGTAEIGLSVVSALTTGRVFFGTVSSIAAAAAANAANAVNITFTSGLSDGVDSLTGMTASTGANTNIDGTLRLFVVNNTLSSEARTSKMTRRVNVYSFALKPEEHQPSGTCNFSRIDNALLKFSGNVTVANIYAVNYNVLRIMSGMGGLAYSN